MPSRSSRFWLLPHGVAFFPPLLFFQFFLASCCCSQVVVVVVVFSFSLLLCLIFVAGSLAPQEDSASGGEGDGIAFGSADENEDGAGGILEPVETSRRECDPVRLHICPPHPLLACALCSFLKDGDKEGEGERECADRERRGGGQTISLYSISSLVFTIFSPRLSLAVLRHGTHLHACALTELQAAKECSLALL